MKDSLFSWFCLTRRSVRSHIPLELMIAKASMLMDEYIEEHAVRGLQADADAAVVNDCWLSRWRFQYGVNLRRPNRRFSVPQGIMLEQMHLLWANVFGARRLMA